MAESMSHRNFNKIFCIGLSRTGTLSLHEALKRLGFTSAHYPRLNDIWDVTEKHDAVSDTPVCLHYIELDKAYPNSKFILTTRKLYDWLKSARWFFGKAKLKGKDLSFQQIFIREVLYGAKWFNEAKYKEGFLTYQDKVFQYFKERPDDLLVMNILEGDGYEKLCPFLNLPRLKENFKHKHNRGKKNAKRISQNLRQPPFE